MKNSSREGICGNELSKEVVPCYCCNSFPYSGLQNGGSSHWNRFDRHKCAWCNAVGASTDRGQVSAVTTMRLCFSFVTLNAVQVINLQQREKHKDEYKHP
ncbi:unnamed protein product [Hermetia illucens]|uniref:Uncharacterized protein n=1 Tax=Hermetia illucens TaxID=343691 RepID=A0A7R8YLJ1_HERIL|nr:unnamed protein product [Hermetia illucens]